MSKPFTVQVGDTLTKCLENQPNSVEMDIVKEALEPSVFLLSSIISKITEERDCWENKHQQLSESYIDLNTKYKQLHGKYSKLLDEYRELANASSKILNTISRL